jgi:2-amino-4-hydroxy-6-hydroxymethyldihydropteridine diphosphokinase
MSRVHIGVGSNIAPATHVPAGLARLHHREPIVTASPFYRTAAIGRPDQDDYWNGIVVVDTERPLEEIQALLHKVEAKQGRLRTPDRYGPRTLDLDVLLWHGAPVDDGAQREILERPYWMRCLLDLDPNAKLDGRPIVDILPATAAFDPVGLALPF